jgi:hypothetical protein
MKTIALTTRYVRYLLVSVTTVAFTTLIAAN